MTKRLSVEVLNPLNSEPEDCSVCLKPLYSKITLTCIITAVVGIILMLGSSLTPGQMTGNLVAFIMPISFAILILIVRKYF